MKKILTILALLCTSIYSAQAADPLANTLWQTYEGSEPKAVIKFTENSKGGIDGHIVSTTRAEGKN